MTDSTIFTEGQTPADGEAPTPPVAIPDTVKELIGEGKKYATVEKALEALGHSQAHIAKIEKENADLRGQAGGVSQEQLLQTVQELLAAERATHGAATASVDEAALASLLDRKLQERQAAEEAQRNVATVKKALQDKYGEKAEEHYKATAEALGVGPKFLNDLVAKSPAAASKLLGLEPGKPSAGSVTKGTVNTAALSNQVVTQPPKKSVMRGASTADMIEEWRRHDPTKKQE